VENLAFMTAGRPVWRGVAFMSSRAQKLALVAVAVVALGALGWAVWDELDSATAAGEGAIEFKVLCANPQCQYFADGNTAALRTKGGGRPARVPSGGPGYICPKCGQATLYSNPYICSDCKTPFLPTADDFRMMRGTCPKCKKLQ
jgi:hypothetical protein